MRRPEPLDRLVADASCDPAVARTVAAVMLGDDGVRAWRTVGATIRETLRDRRPQKPPGRGPSASQGSKSHSQNYEGEMGVAQLTPNAPVR